MIFRDDHHEINLGEDGILYLKLSGDSKTESVEHFFQAIKNFIADHPRRKFSLFVEMRSASSTTSQGVRLYAELMKMKEFEKLALVHTKEVPRMFAEMVITLAHKKTVKFFNDQDEALSWLKEKNK